MKRYKTSKTPNKSSYDYITSHRIMSKTGWSDITTVGVIYGIPQLIDCGQKNQKAVSFYLHVGAYYYKHALSGQYELWRTQPLYNNDYNEVLNTIKQGMFVAIKGKRKSLVSYDKVNHEYITTNLNIIETVDILSTHASIITDFVGQIKMYDRIMLGGAEIPEYELED